MSCGSCKYFDFAGGGFICKRHAMIIPSKEEPWEKDCPEYIPDLAFKTKKDVYDYFYNYKCGGCEYSVMDREGNESPSMEDGCCCGCYDELNFFEDDIEKLTLEQAIKRWSPGNDRRDWPAFCGVRY